MNDEFYEDDFAEVLRAYEQGINRSTSRQHRMNTTASAPTACQHATETRQAYLDLVIARACGNGHPCLRDDCDRCIPLLALIDTRGLECDARGCTVAHCVNDRPAPSEA